MGGGVIAYIYNREGEERTGVKGPNGGLHVTQVIAENLINCHRTLNISPIKGVWYYFPLYLVSNLGSYMFQYKCLTS